MACGKLSESQNQHGEKTSVSLFINVFTRNQPFQSSQVLLVKNINNQTLLVRSNE